MTDYPASMPEKDEGDRIVHATRTVAYVILFNKPFYPVYVWYLVGRGTAVSCLTLLAVPLFAAIILVSRDRPALARLMLPVVGTVDTVAETFVFGQSSGCGLFLAACAMLAAVSFHDDERFRKIAVTCFIFAGFLLTQISLGGPLFPWTPDELATLRNLNIFALASLLAFISIRFPSSRRICHRASSHS